MSFYYKYKFVSPASIFALVKEELKSYFDTGAVDDTLFTIYTDQCLKKLGKASYPIAHAMLCQNNFESRLPDDFYGVREAWGCCDYTQVYQLPSALYTQISTRLDDDSLVCNVGCESPDIIQAVYKTTETVAFEWKKTHLLKPGNIYPACPEDLYCANYNSISDDSYDIRDNKFITSFASGNIYLQYYSNQFDCENQLIPDEYRIQKFIELFIKEKIFEQLKNQATDDTKNQLRKDYEDAKRVADEAYILADMENKKEDAYRKQRAIKRVQDRFKRYDIR